LAAPLERKVRVCMEYGKVIFFDFTYPLVVRGTHLDQQNQVGFFGTVDQVLTQQGHIAGGVTFCYATQENMMAHVDVSTKHTQPTILVFVARMKEFVQMSEILILNMREKINDVV
jgi:hypothetical protein